MSVERWEDVALLNWAEAWEMTFGGEPEPVVVLVEPVRVVSVLTLAQVVEAAATVQLSLPSEFMPVADGELFG